MVIHLLRVLILSLSLWSQVGAQEAYRPAPGTIPLKYGGYPATDLVLDGRVLLPEEAHQLYLEQSKHTRGGFTLADLDPEENDIWKNVLSLPLHPSLDELPINDQLDTVSFVSYSITRLENYRFTVSKDHSFYLAYMGPKIHNFLLRKNLLRKLGYNVPAVKHLKNIKVEFKTALERDDFLLDFQATVGRDIDRWVTSAPEGANFFYAQDLIVMEDQNTLPNLSVGYLSEDVIDGRRIFNSLAIPYAIMDVPESVNMLSWVHGKVFSENVVMPFENGEAFNPSSDDARWMVRRVLSLTEADWTEIVEKAHLPAPVAALMLEKMKSRRNHLASLFGVNAKKFKVDANYTDQDKVVKNGKLEQEFFEGYGRRFKIPDPESPLSFSEMSSLFKAKLLGQGIDLLVTAFNSAPWMSWDVSDKIAAINTDIGSKAEALLKEGKPLKGLVDGYVFPTVSGKLILSRDIVAGSYLGTDNLIQLVDTIGFSVSAGALGGLAGLFTKTGDYMPAVGDYSYVPVPVSASAMASFTRNYAHVKPITSVKKALKYPFKNMLIPLLKRKQGKILKAEAERDFDQINALVRAERDKEYEKIYQAITKELEVGESLIITDSVNLGLAGEAKLNLYNVANIRGKIGGHSLVLSRLHILRKSQTVIQVYKDLGQNNGYEISLGVDKFVPILKVSLKGSKGIARTRFYNVQLKEGAQDFKQKLLALSAVFKSNSLKALEKEQKPFVLKHSFNEFNPSAGILVWRWNYLDSTDNITVTAPSGDEKKYVRRYKGWTLGRDYETYAQDLIGSLTSYLLKTQFSASSFTSKTNAGFTFYGKALNKIQVFEGEVGKDGKVTRPYTRLTRIWNGWSADKKKALKILAKIKERYRFNFMPEEVLAQTKKLFLYNFNVNLYVHAEGIQEFLRKSDEEIKAVFKKHQSRDLTNFSGDDALIFSGYRSVVRWKKKYEKRMKKNDVHGASKYLLKITSMLERKLTADGYSAIYGKGNFLLIARIDGFRIGDENGDQALVSSTLGTRGNDNLGGPTAEILEFFRVTGSETMTEGEFYVNWLLGRII